MEILCKKCKNKENNSFSGQAISDYICIDCGETRSHSNTGTPIRCYACAVENQKCQRCDNTFIKEYMTKLDIYLPLEVIMKSKKLQEIKTTRYTVIYPDGQKRNETGFPRMTDMIYVSCYPILSIADIIDNSEMLFGNKKCRQDNSWRFTATDLLVMAWDNKSIEQISKYITDNLK